MSMMCDFCDANSADTPDSQHFITGNRYAAICSLCIDKAAEVLAGKRRELTSTVKGTAQPEGEA